MGSQKPYNTIPTVLTEKEFDEFVLPHLKKGSRGPSKKISFFKLFNYILKLMHTGCQSSNIPIEKDKFGNPEIHYTSIFKMFRFWVKEGCFDNIFESSVLNCLNIRCLIYQLYTVMGHLLRQKKGR